MVRRSGEEICRGGGSLERSVIWSGDYRKGSARSDVVMGIISRDERRSLLDSVSSDVENQERVGGVVSIVSEREQASVSHRVT